MPKVDISPVAETIHSLRTGCEVLALQDNAIKNFKPQTGKPLAGHTQLKKMRAAYRDQLQVTINHAQVLVRWALFNKRGQPLASTTQNKRMSSLLSELSKPSPQAAQLLNDALLGLRAD